MSSSHPVISYRSGPRGRMLYKRSSSASSKAASAAYDELQDEVRQSAAADQTGGSWWVGGQASDPSIIGGLRFNAQASVSSRSASRRRGRRSMVSPVGPGTINLLSDKPLNTLVPSVNSLFSGSAQGSGLFAQGTSIGAKVNKPAAYKGYASMLALRELKTSDGVPEEIQGTDLFDKGDGTWEKQEVVAFGNNPNDPASMALSPQLCKRVDPNQPVIGGAYPTVDHYVEMMRINTATPGQTALGLINQPSQVDSADQCAMARASMQQIRTNRYVPIVRSIAATCDTAAIGNRYYEIATGSGRYTTSMFLGLWNKITNYDEYYAALVNTGKKLLIYVDDSDTRKLAGIDPNGAGGNIIGLLLMIIRAIIVKFPGEARSPRTNPADLYRKVGEPYLKKMFGKTDVTALPAVFTA